MSKRHHRSRYYKKYDAGLPPKKKIDTENLTDEDLLILENLCKTWWNDGKQEEFKERKLFNIESVSF